MFVDRLLKPLGLTSLIALIAILGAACTGTQTPPAKTSSSDEASSAGRAVGASNSPAAKSEPSPGIAVKPRGILRQLGEDPPTLDPSLVQDATSAEYMYEIFSGLVTIDKSLKVVPDLAESWEISGDGTIYTFKLRPNATFHNGKPVTAKDFKYAIERATDPATGSLVADTYLGDIVGVPDKLQGQATDVKGVEVVDDHTLKITIDAPKAYFLAKLTYPTAFALDEENVKSGRNWTDKANGTGPFKLKEWKRGDRITLVANENFYNGPVRLAELQYLLAGGSSMTMYENDEIDIGGANVNEIERVTDPAGELSKQLKIVNGFSVEYIGFNVNLPPFDDPKVRQAFNYATDKKRIAQVVLKDLVTPAYTILPPGFPGYNEGLQGLQYDPAKAKQLLAESKYAGNLPPITLALPGQGAGPGRTVEAMIEMWKENLGVEVNTELTEFATYLEDLKQHRYQTFEIGWVADYPDPQNFLDILFYSKSNDNNTRYNNPEVDALLEKARVEQNPEERVRLYQEAEKIIVNDAAWLPLFYGKSYYLIKPYVTNFQPSPIPTEQYKDVIIESH